MKSSLRSEHVDIKIEKKKTKPQAKKKREAETRQKETEKKEQKKTKKEKATEKKREKERGSSFKKIPFQSYAPPLQTKVIISEQRKKILCCSQLEERINK